MRLLIRARPGIHVADVVVLALEGERAGLGPGAHDEVVRFVEALVRNGWVDTEGMVFRADASHETADQPATGNDVDHRMLLGHGERMRSQRQRTAQDADLYPLRATRQRRSGDDRRGHQPVRRLVMLVHRHRVETERLAVFQLVQVAVVELVALFRVEMPVRQIDPHGGVPAPGLEIEVRVGHEMEQNYLHTSSTN